MSQTPTKKQKIGASASAASAAPAVDDSIVSTYKLFLIPRHHLLRFRFF